MKIRAYIILILVLFLASSCDIGCVYPGDGLNATSRDVEVPVKIGDNMSEADPKTLWVDSGISVTEQDEVPISIRGQINFCDGINQFNNSCDQEIENNCKVRYIKQQ